MITKYKSNSAPGSSFLSGKKSSDDSVIFKPSQNNFSAARKPAATNPLNNPLNIDAILREDKEFLRQEGKPLENRITVNRPTESRVTLNKPFESRISKPLESRNAAAKPATDTKTAYGTRSNNFGTRRSYNQPVKTAVAPRQIFSQQSNGNSLRIMVLGGLEEVGRNMTVFEYNKEIMIIDMGLQFPEEDMPGIDYIIPNVTYLQDKKDWIKGVIISHGHYDHIGAIPHIMGEIGNPPMFMGKLTAGLVRKRHIEYKNAPVLKIKEIDDTTNLKLGSAFNLEFLRVNHSIPDCFATVIKTPMGTVIHTGDFKIDFTPVNDKPADLNRMAQIGAAGVRLLMSDSTDATHPGYQVSESYIGEEMGKLFEKIEGRVIIGTFASQLSRVQKIFDLAEKHGRRVSLQGRSMISNVEVAHEIGYLKFNPKILIDDKDLNKMPDNKVMIVGTGAQGESNAFLSRVVNGEHRVVSIKHGDTVLFSSSVYSWK